MSKIKSIAFDLEGTIIDLEALHHKAHILSAKEIRLDLTLDDCFKLLPHFIGGPDEVVAEEIAALAHKKGLQADAVKICNYKTLYFQKLINNSEVKLRKGFQEFFNAAKERGFLLTIGSLTWKEPAMVLVKRSGLNTLIDIDKMVFREDVARPKPAPDVWIETAKIAGVKPDEQLVFEDSPRGIQGAKSVGAYCVAIPTLHRPELINALRKAGADRIYSGWDEIDIDELLSQK